MNLDGTRRCACSPRACAIRSGWTGSRSTGALWTAVNERDELGDNLVPDLHDQREGRRVLRLAVRYFGQHEDPRVQGERPDLVAKAIVPDCALGSHTASLGLVFYRGDAFPARYRGGVFIGQHGSWNRSKFAATGWHSSHSKTASRAARPRISSPVSSPNRGDVYGRPVGVTVDRTGALLVADDAGNIVWRVAAAKGGARASS